jgi:LacI family transcriptional regulator
VNKRAATITDVARAAGVSTATVSRVLNGASTVDPTLASRVREVVADVGYVPNPHGRALRRQRSDVWAAVVSDVQNPFFTAMVAAVETVAIGNGYSVMLCNTDEQLSRERTYLETAVAKRMAGVVVSVTSETESDITPVLDAGIPTVVVDRRVAGFDGDTVLLDNLRAGRLAAEHLLELGHYDIACVAGPPDVSTTEDRLTGFRETLAQAGRPLPEERILRSDLRPEGGEAATRALLSDGHAASVTALFSTNGPLTSGAYLGIQVSGRRMPTDLSMVGFDDDRWTRMVSPAVTVVAQPVTEMGRRAAEILLAREQGEGGESQHVVLLPELHVRATTAPAPSRVTPEP